MSQPNFLSELKRRNVYKVAIAYIVAGWAIAQGIAQVLPVFDVSNGIIRLLVTAVILGFPVAMVFAWFFELTPEGIKRAEDVDPAKPHSVYGAWIYIALIGAAALATLFFIGRSGALRSEGARKSIAVLPFENLSDDKNDEYFSDGLSEELIVALGHLQELKVIGRSSSFRFKTQKAEPRAIGEKLGVANLLEGTVRKQGDRVRIVASLVNVADGVQLWTNTFDRQLKDIFEVQEEIAAAVADSLKLKLLGPASMSARAGGSENTEAYNAYLQGHFHFLRRNLEDYKKALLYYDEALRVDPNYALVYAERSELFTLVADLTAHRDPEWPNARRDAEKAVAIAPKLAEAHAALGWVRFFVDWKFSEGLAALKRAKDLAPANPTANDLLARVIVYLGRLDEAERQARQAAELDPLSVSAWGNLARVLFSAGKLDEADAIARKAADLQPASASSRRWQVFVAVTRGDGETALREAKAEPDERFHRFLTALAYFVRGEKNAADDALAALIAKDRDQFAYQIAQVYAVRGEKDKAFEWLQISLDTHDAGTLSLLIDPLLANLRQDPRYRGLLVKLGLPAPS